MCGLVHGSATVAKVCLVTSVVLALAGDPAVERDHADHPKSGVAEGRSQLGQSSALTEIRRELIIPGLDRRVPRLARQPDLLQQRRRPDRAGVQAIDHDKSPLVPGSLVFLVPGEATTRRAFVEFAQVGSLGHPVRTVATTYRGLKDGEDEQG